MSIPNEHLDKDSKSSGAEIERTHESYAKGYPAPGTKDAGEEGKDFVPQAGSEDEESGKEEKA